MGLTSSQVDQHLLDIWSVKAKTLIVNTCGKPGEHITAFEEAEKPGYGPRNDYDKYLRAKAAFLAAKDDFQGGFLTSVKNLAQAELFDSELEQASELLASGYKGPAAVVAGVVLETALRDICDQNDISREKPRDKLDVMNSAIAKNGIYRKLQQKQITTLADIRNNAAHGHWESFSDSNVKDMIRDVESFLLNYLA